MKKAVSHVVLTLMLAFGLFSFNGIIFADSENQVADQDIKSEIQTEYNLHFAESVNSSKKEFGTQDSDFKNGSQIGDGIAFYSIPTEDSDQLLKFAGYIFPLNLDDKQIASIYAINDGGWKILKISDLANVVQTVADVKATLKEGEEIKLIDDLTYGVNGIYVKGLKDERMQ